MNQHVDTVAILSSVTEFLARRHGHFIDGKSVIGSDSGRLDVFDPATGRVISSVPAGRETDIDTAVKAAQSALDGAWATLRPADREHLLYRFSQVIAENAEELAQIETLNQGKSINLARDVEVGGSVEYVRYMAGWATKIEGSTLDLSIPVPPGTRYTGLTLREPVGVVGAIVPWNFPLMIAVQKIAPALACGCTVVLKPSEDTPLTALRLAELAIEAGIPPGVINVVTGRGGEAGAALARHPGVAKISFTGSTVTGRAVGEAALVNFARCTLELGGKNPMIIMSDIDVESMLPGIMAGCFFNQGQVCAAASRIYVHKPIFDRVVERMRAAMGSLKIGPGMDPTMDLQPLVSRQHQSKVASLVDAARNGGAQVVTGGNKGDGEGFFYEPTMILNADTANPANTTEFFGPVVSVVPVDDLTAGIEAANLTSYGLAASIWTNDLQAAFKAVRALRAGTVWINSHIPIDPNLPFGGFKQSGIGREHGRSMIEQYTELKSVIIPGF